MKILINRCYGGFGLSKKARDLLVERGFEHAIASQKEDPTCQYSYRYYLINQSIKMSDIEFRMNPMIIQVVEELEDDASGPCSDIKVIEFNLEDCIEIKDYDGKERLILNGCEHY